jgi:hypothetical protein
MRMKYEKPVLTCFDLDVSIGADCSGGSKAGVNCAPGTGATPCSIGSSVISCYSGNLHTNSCRTGTKAPSCSSGSSVGS